MFEMDSEVLAVLPERLETSAMAVVYQGASVWQSAGGDSFQYASISQAAQAIALDL